MSNAPVVPAEIAAILEDFDQRPGVLTELDISSAIQKARAPSNQVPEAENSGAWAELLAFCLTPAFSTRNHPWNTYFGPNGWREGDDRKRVYFPSLDGVGPEFLDHWAQRAATVQNPILKARYADLCWDLGRIIGGKRPDIEVARTAIDAYLAGVEQGRHPDDMRRFPALQRALRLAVQIRDEARIDRARAAVLAFHRDAMHRIDAGQRGAWWMGFREMLDNKGGGFTETERALLVADIERVFATRAAPGDPKAFDPNDARNAAETLIRYYRTQSNSEEVKRLQGALAECLEHFAGLGDAMLAAGTLQECVEHYRGAGRPVDAKRAQRTLQDKIRECKALMGQHEFVQKIPKEQMEAWLAEKCEGGPDAALVRITMEFLTRRREIQHQIAETAKHAPLFSMIPKSLHAEDHVAATVGSVEEDPTGALVFESGRWLELSTFWLYHAIEHAIEMYGLDASHLVGRINISGLFGDDTAFLEKGVQAWFDEDHVEAVHLLVPQIERAIRELMERIGQPVTKPVREVDGASQAIGIGDALHSADFEKAFGPDLRLHLMALYADPRGWNLRNRMAHGTLRADEIDAGMTAWLIQTLLLLGLRAALVGEQGDPLSPDQ